MKYYLLLVWCVFNIMPFVRIAYVINQDSGTITPINLETNTPSPPIFVGGNPSSIVITADGKTAFVTNIGTNSVQRIDLITRTITANIALGNQNFPNGAALTPDNTTLWVADFDNSGLPVGKLIPIDTTTNAIGTPILLNFGVGLSSFPLDVVITSDGITAYVSLLFNNKVIPINLITHTVGTPIIVGTSPDGLVITPDDATVYVGNEFSNNVIPIDTLTNTAQAPIAVGVNPIYLAITPLGTFVYVTNTGSDSVSVIDVQTNTVVDTIPMAGGPFGLAIDPQGQEVVVTLAQASSVQIIFIPSNMLGPIIPVGANPVGVAINQLQPFPPASFTGRLRANLFLDDTEYILELTIGASSDPVQLYRIFKNGFLVLETTSLDPFLCLGKDINTGGFSVAAVANGIQSDLVPLRII